MRVVSIIKQMTDTAKAVSVLCFGCVDGRGILWYNENEK